MLNETLKGSRITVEDALYVYVCIVFFLPGQAFEQTSLFTFYTPISISYKYLTFPISYLYIPLLVAGFYYYFSSRGKMPSRIVAFMAALFIKDCILTITCIDDYLFAHMSFEWYALFAVAIALLAIVFYTDQKKGKPYRFMFIAMWTTIGTMIIVILLRIGPDLVQFAGRYSSFNLGQGDTAFFLATFALFYLGDRKLSLRWPIIALCLLLIMPTGSRKEVFFLGFVFLVHFIFLALTRKTLVSDVSSINQPRYSYSEIIVFSCCIIGASALFVSINQDLLEILNIDRYSPDGMTGTDLVEGRIDSLAAGMSILSDNWLLGLNFSFYDLQMNMQMEGYPTFPHFGWLFNWVLMGLLVVVPLAMTIKATIILMKNGDPVRYCALHFVIVNMFSGGAWTSFKGAMFFLYVFWLIIWASRKYKNTAGTYHMESSSITNKDNAVTHVLLD